MSRKKVTKKTIKKKPLSKRPPKLEISKQKLISTKAGLMPAPEKPKRAVKPNTNKYLLVKDTEPRSRFVEVGEMVQRKELKWAYFGVENQVGIHYYLILNVEKKWALN